MAFFLHAVVVSYLQI